MKIQTISYRRNKNLGNYENEALEATASIDEGESVGVAIDALITRYRLLNEQGYYWDAGAQRWQRLAQDADPPTDLIRVRVWAEDSKVRGTAYQMRVALEEQGYVFLEQSEPYPCRPPKQLESRIYLTFR